MTDIEKLRGYVNFFHRVMNPVLTSQSVKFMYEHTALSGFGCPSEHDQFMVV